MKKLIVTSLSILLAVSLFGQSDKRLKGIEAELNEMLELSQAAGFAVAIVEKDKIIYSKGFGYRDYENKVKVDGNTLFAIGSCTKAFTAGLLGMLREEDKLSFDDSPRKHIPYLEFYNDNLNNNITIADLMSHRTGIPRYDGAWYHFPHPNRDTLISRIKYHKPLYGIRENFLYNNFMFAVQGVIAEKITGKSWEDNIRERFLKPLNMNRTIMTIDEIKKDDNAALGYYWSEDKKITKTDYYDISAMSPAGSINSSVNDMSNWVITWINQGKFKENQLLTSQYINQAKSSHIPVGRGLPRAEMPNVHGGGYGYGWMTASYKGHYSVSHGGAIDGFTAHVGFYPSDDIGIIVLANQGDSFVPSIVANMIADRMLEVDKTDFIKDIKKRLAEIKDVESVEVFDGEKIKNVSYSHKLVDYEGAYSHPGFGKFTIQLKNDSLFAQLPLYKAYLFHDKYDVFSFREVTETGIDTTDFGFSVNFNSDFQGEISGLDVYFESSFDEPQVFERTPLKVTVPKKVLETYLGKYDGQNGVKETATVFIDEDDPEVLKIDWKYLSEEAQYYMKPLSSTSFYGNGTKLSFTEQDGKMTIDWIEAGASYKYKKVD
ncbi:MAG: serine hydrolase [Flavobacteriales bacterium]|nr:serine hydrolase [Flavobacteriales bacterium]